jgi:hypothetical protein
MSSYPVPSQFYAGLQQSINAALPPGTKVVPIDYDGGFNYYWQIIGPTGANLFNYNTFNYVANRMAVDTATGGLMGAGTILAQDFVSEMSGIRFLLSQADAAKLTAVQSKLQQLGQTIVQDYTQAYGPITSTQLAAASTALNWPPAMNFTAVDFVIQYIAGYIWSGSYQSKTLPLTYSQLGVASSLPAMDAQGAQVWGDVQLYLNESQSIWGIQDELGTNNGILAILKNNIKNPSATNGGMVSQDVSANQYTTVGYSLSPSPQQIETQLQNAAQKISLQLTAAVSNKQVSVQIGSQSAMSVDAGWFTCSFGTSSSSYNLTDIQGAGTSLSVSIQFPGWQLVQVSPTPFNNNVGWWDSSILAATVQNTSQDVTGFRWVTGQAPVAFDFQPTGNFGQMDTLLISQSPTVTITFNKGSYHSFSQVYQSASSSTFSIFGIPFSTQSSSTYSSSLQQGSSDSSFTLTMAPNFGTVLAQTQLQRQAFVLGGTATFPGATAS